MDQFCYFSDDDDDDSAAVEELLSEFLDDNLLKLTTNPIGRPGSADSGLEPELETRYEKLKASVSKPRPVASAVVVEKPENEAADAQSSSSSSKGNELSSSTAHPWDSTSSSSDARRTTSSSSPRILRASSPPSRRLGSPPPPKSCFCGSPRRLLRSLSSRRSSSSRKSLEKKNKKSIWSEPRSVREETLAEPADDLKEEEVVSVISEETRVSGDDKDRGRGKGKGKGKGRSHDEWDSLSDEEFLTDLSTFSLKNQEKQLKKAVKEERRASRDAEDLVKWVKQASARLDVSVIDDLLSDEEELK